MKTLKNIQYIQNTVQNTQSINSIKKLHKHTAKLTSKYNPTQHNATQKLHNIEKYIQKTIKPEEISSKY